jgi:hypothetical protein
MALGGKDAWPIRIDDDGNLLWERSYGGSDDDYQSALLKQEPVALYWSQIQNQQMGTRPAIREEMWIAYLTSTGISGAAYELWRHR